jgi:hypothetical protein
MILIGFINTFEIKYKVSERMKTGNNCYEGINYIEPELFIHVG